MKASFTPGRVAEIAGVTREQLLRLEDEGVVAPERDERNHRVFRTDDVRRVLEAAGRDVRRRIAVVNQKGGVGKTTTAFNLSAALALEGRRVLVVDLDAQASLTISFGLNPDELPKTSFDLLLEEETSIDEVILETKHEGLDVVPADMRLAKADVALSETIMRERILLTKLEPVLETYDFILFDCPPNLSTISLNALVAATDAIVPLETQFYSIRAVEDLSKILHLLATRMNHRIDVFMLPMKIDRRMKMSREFLEQMEKSFAGRLLTPIRTDANLMKAPLAKEPAVHAFPSSRGAKDYRRVAREVVEHASVARG